jgi:2-iminoacetate synthase ThiH
MLRTAIKGALGLLRRPEPEPSFKQFPNEDLYETLTRCTRQQVKDDYKNDPWSQNFFLNCWEYATAQDVLESYPWNVALPFADLCNARCTFCDSWLRGEGVMKLDEIERFVEV